MKKIFNLEIITSIVCFALFILLVVLLTTVDVAAIGPQNSLVGLSSLNKTVFEAVGRSDFWYNLTEIFGYLTILVAGFFACLGLLSSEI